MATILLSAAGAAIGGSIGGTIAGLSMAAVGKAAGAVLGRVIDQRIMGGGSEAIETGKVDRFRLTSASEGAPIGQQYGRMRMAGQVIWATRFQETSTTTGGGGKGPPKPTVTQYSYSVSLAIALSEGEITRVGRVWADGVEVARDDLNMRVYIGAVDQQPDPKIEAVEGAGQAPAYRGTAYVVFEDLQLAQFGNRVPQFSFEVLRPTPADIAGAQDELTRGIKAVALMPATGEYALATTPVTFEKSAGRYASANINTVQGKTDFAASVDALGEELPNCQSVSLIVSWFGNDLRCDHCQIKPKVENAAPDGKDMAWSVSGLSRGQADLIAQIEDRPVYGGTPTDQSVIEAIKHLNAQGQDVMFYPFILMEQLENNGLPDPWTGAQNQATLPWRGRITTSKAPGQTGTPDHTIAAVAEVDAFFGQASVGDFTQTTSGVSYSGPQEWSFRRFILHYAHLCAAAGGVSAFCIGSEMRGVTHIRGANHSFPAVNHLRSLAADVRAILGPNCKIGYAADWSEYFGYQPQDGSNTRYFHLDPLWADPEIDFIGIDNYMPLSDWRDGMDHLDADHGSIYNLDYLRGNIAGGEGYDWYYHSPEAEAAQIRTPIEDGAHNEPWIYRYKDLKNWWSQHHHERIDGVRQSLPTAWQPESKPFWFTELGCAAIDKGTNQPNKFLDPKSSESSLPKYSNGARDDFIQMQYLRAMFSYWRDPDNNPVSPDTLVQMVDMGRAHVWAWDARPFPAFPNALDVWSDGENYDRGHWLNGRVSNQPLSSVVAEICERSGLQAYDVSDLYGVVRGYSVGEISSARAALQPLMLAYGFDAIERDGMLRFKNREGQTEFELSEDSLAFLDEHEKTVEATRAPSAEISGRVRLSFIESESDYETRAEEAIFPDETTRSVSHSEVPLVLTGSEGLQITERWLAEARTARDTVRFALPPSMSEVGAGDIVSFDTNSDAAAYRIDHLEEAGAVIADATRVSPNVFLPSPSVASQMAAKSFIPPLPVYPVFLDLPLMTGDEIPHAPHIAVAADPWPGTAAVYSAAQDTNYQLKQVLSEQSVIGFTKTPFARAYPAIWDRGAALEVELVSGELSSVTENELLGGANLAAIGDGSSDNWELFQFQTVELVGARTYRLTNRLRGQLGSDAIMPESWAPGSTFVLISGALGQLDLSAAHRDIAQHYRIGPANRGYDDPSYTYQVEAFKGIGLRPYAPVHLRATKESSGDVSLGWTRRTRLEGDAWGSNEVPLAETSEAYQIRVLHNLTVLREETVISTAWTYTSGDQVADGVTAPYHIEVAQLSDRFGAGPFRRIEIDV
jgi:hypothetical protein